MEIGRERSSCERNNSEIIDVGLNRDDNDEKNNYSNDPAKNETTARKLMSAKQWQ